MAAATHQGHGNRPDATEIDVLVVGAGSAGVAAACAASETGADTLLVECSGHVGGTLAWQLLEHSAGFHDVAGNQVTAGFAQRLIDLLSEYGGTPGHVRDDVGYTATRTPVNHAELALAEAALLRQAGVQLWLNARAVEVVVEDQRARSVLVHSALGTRRLVTQVIVDCTGDGVVANLAGARDHHDVQDAVQPASLLFKLGGVDFTALLDYARNHAADFRDRSIIGDPTAEHVNLWGFGDLLRAGHASGSLKLRRKELHLAGWPRRGEAVVNVTRLPMDDGADQELGGLYPSLAIQVLEFARWFRLCVPGCAQAYVADVADRVGVRESRRIVGDYTLTQDDVLSGRRFPDVVAQASFPIDIHAAHEPSLSHTEQIATAYDIPYRCLVAAGLRNILVAGRCVSTTHEANGSARITATCFATGEAAGVAAALAGSAGTDACHVPVAEIQRELIARGAILSLSVDLDPQYPFLP